jgi:nitrate reductase NapE component
MIYLILWCIAAMLTAKAIAMHTKEVTVFWMFLVAFVTWPVLAVALTFTPHDCGETYEL